MEYKSQCGQDQWVVEEVFPGLTCGRFIDLAAGDGVLLSNTYVMEKYLNWTGLCIEAHPTTFSNLIKNRLCMCDNSVILKDDVEVHFLSGKQKTELYHEHDHLFSRIDSKEYPGRGDFELESDEIRKCVSLHTILEKSNAPNIIHYLSLDVEGTEGDVLDEFFKQNTKRHILCITVETPLGGKNHSEILSANNYVYVKSQGCDDFYLKKDYKTFLT